MFMPQCITPVSQRFIAVRMYNQTVNIGYALALVTTWIAIVIYLAGMLRPTPKLV